MESFVQDFTTRQYMITPDFEYFHYKDNSTIEIDYHNHEFYEIYFFLSGNVTYLIEGRSYSLKAGDILLIQNHELHKPIIEAGKAYERIVLWVSPDYLLRCSQGNTNLSMCFESVASQNYNLLRPGADEIRHIRLILDRFEAACRSLSFGSSVLKDIYLLEYLVFINRAFLETYNSDVSTYMDYNEHINEIISYINNHLNKDLSLDHLSNKFHTSKYHLIREFKKYTGFTVHQYIQQKRLLMAKTLLKDGMQVSEACIKSGFTDYSNFIRAFKKRFGMPPKKYIKSQ